MTRLLATVSGYARIDSPPPMTYRTCQPSPPLDQFVDWYWFYSDLQAAHSVERVLPDGTFEFIIDLSDVPRKLFDRDNPGKYREFRGAWLSGARAELILIDVIQKTSMIGAHFKPGGAAAFMRMPAGELTSRVEESESIWGGAARDLRARLLEEESISGRFRLLEAFLRGQLVATTGNAGICSAIERLTASPQVDRISGIAADLGLSQKHFIDLFRDRVGLTPKKFCRVRRFQNALHHMEYDRRLDWAGLATDIGYYDQSHFIRDFHSFAGLNPSAYLTERGEYVGFIPVRE